MQNYWMNREALKTELEAEYKAKLEAATQEIRHEFETNLEEGYEEAYQMLLAERKSKETLEVDMYDDYDKKLKECKEYIVTKVDEYLEQFWQKLCEAGEQEQADLLASWRKVATADDIVETAIGNRKETYDEAVAAKRILEAKNMRMAVENQKLTEQVRELSSMICQQGQLSKQAMGLGLKAGQGLIASEQAVEELQRIVKATKSVDLEV